MAQALQLVTGASAGFNYSRAREKERETMQGKNYYQASIFQAAQITQLGNVASQLSNAIPSTYIRTTVKIAVTGTSVIAWGACPMFAAAKQGHFEDGMTAVKSVVQVKSPKIASYLPDKLGKDSERLFSYLAEHSGSITKILMVTGTIALPWVGSSYFALGVLAPITYHAIDSRGLVPRKTSLFIETYMPTIASVGAILGGGLVVQGMAVFQVLSYSPTFNKFLHQKIDKVAKKFIDLPGSSVEEIDAPVLVNKQLSFNQINTILAATRPTKFTVNAAHCSKPVWSFKKLPKNFAFSKFLDLFRTVKWEDKYSLLKKPFAEDDRFIDYLKDQFRDQKDVQSRFEYYLDLHAKGMKITKEEFLANQLEKQMTELIKMLKGERRAEGSQKDADEAIHYCSQVLAYLLKLNLDTPSERVILEDILMKLGIEGGEYCARGVKRASKEIVNGVLQQLTDGEGDPIKDYERQLQQALEAARTKLLNSLYQGFIGAITSALKGNEINDDDLTKEVTDTHAVAAAQDVHTLDLYRLAFAFGVVPLSDYERNSMGLTELNFWGNPMYPFREFRMNIYDNYYRGINDVIKELGHIHFSNYILAVIEQNTVLNEAQKAEIRDKFTECNNGEWSVESTQSRFNRLACVMLGILNYESIRDDWVRIDSNDLPPLEDPGVIKKTDEQDTDEEWELL